MQKEPSFLGHAPGWVHNRLQTSATSDDRDSPFPVTHPSLTPLTHAHVPGVMSRLEPTGTSSLSGDPRPRTDHRFGSAAGGLGGGGGEAVANIQASENAWGVPRASQGEPGYTNHLWSVWQAVRSRVDSSMKLKTGSWGEKTRTAHVPVQVFPISPTVATLHGNQHLQALGLHACWTPTHSGVGGQVQISSEGAESRKRSLPSTLSNPRAFSHP